MEQIVKKRSLTVIANLASMMALALMRLEDTPAHASQAGMVITATTISMNANQTLVKMEELVKMI